MFSVLKFIYIVFRASQDMINPNINPLRHAPAHIKYFASILLSCFWCLAFGLYIGELLTIGYNMLGHIAIVSMVFATWAVFKSMEKSIVQDKDQWTTYACRIDRADVMS